jgi:DNA-binding transcriptional ArsR family regulator
MDLNFLLPLSRRASGGRGRKKKKRLTYAYMGMYGRGMARAATTSDAFNAVAEPRRREILNYLALRERPVGDIVATLDLGQPSVSKHLRVLRNVGLVRVRRDGRQKLYRTNAEAIRPLHEWAGTFERYWQHQLNRVKERAEAKMKKDRPDLKPRRNHDSDSTEH